MEKARLGIGAKLLIAAIVVFVVWLAIAWFRETGRIRELADLPPCTLAAEYVEWRLAYEEEHPADATSEPSDEFVSENEIFEQAIRRAREASDSHLLEELEDLTAIDSARWIRERADLGPFVQVMLAECPEEIEVLMQRSVQ